MLSILIPEYNTDVRLLVSQLWDQANQLAVPFEIIVLDDASDNPWKELNHSITQYANCIFQINTIKCGRSATRNKLAKSAQYNYLLFLDADVQLQNNRFLKTYLELLTDHTQSVIYGGCVYHPDRPGDSNLLLHWLYGTQIENPPLAKRLKDPYNTFHTVNFLVPKNILLQFPFDETIRYYGFEDLMWAYVLKQNNIVLKHIDNPVVHQGIHPTRQFLRHTVSAVRNVIKIKKSNENTLQTKLTKLADYLFLFHIHKLCYFLYQKQEKKIIGNLRSQKPNLLLLQVFKLGIYLRFWNKT